MRILSCWTTHSMQHCHLCVDSSGTVSKDSPSHPWNWIIDSVITINAESFASFAFDHRSVKEWWLECIPCGYRCCCPSQIWVTLLFHQCVSADKQTSFQIKAQAWGPWRSVETSTKTGQTRESKSDFKEATMLIFCWCCPVLFLNFRHICWIWAIPVFNADEVQVQ